MANTIVLKGDHVRKEGVASSAITPGEIVERGGSDDYQAHSTAAGDAQRAFAVENDLVGEDISDDYDAGDTVQVAIVERGGEVQARAGATDISEGNLVESDGSGRVVPLGTTTAAGTEIVIGEALEAQTTTDGLVEIEVF